VIDWHDLPALRRVRERVRNICRARGVEPVARHLLVGSTWLLRELAGLAPEGRVRVLAARVEQFGLPRPRPPKPKRKPKPARHWLLKSRSFRARASK
jgi:hypothetical protein